MTTKIKDADQKRTSSPPSFQTAKICAISALALFTIVNFLYASNRASFLSENSSNGLSVITLILLLGGSGFLCLAAGSYLKNEERASPSSDDQSRIQWPLGKIISDAFFHHKKVIAISAIIYAIFYAFIDGILVYQPGVDFASQYFVNTPTALVEYCCGPPGYIPVGLVYFPQQHFGVELIPISVLTMILVSLLVGLNVSLLYSAVKQTTDNRSLGASSGKKFAGGAIGAVLGLFAGCPTCAAAFFLSMIAGSGATAFSAVVSEYQPVIIGLSVPLLFLSILYQAKNLRTILLGCTSGI